MDDRLRNALFVLSQVGPFRLPQGSARIQRMPAGRGIEVAENGLNADPLMVRVAAPADAQVQQLIVTFSRSDAFGPQSMQVDLRRDPLLAIILPGERLFARTAAAQRLSVIETRVPTL